MRWSLWWLSLAYVVGCEAPSTIPVTPTPNPVVLLEAKAADARARDDRETEALALREALEKFPAGSSTRLPGLRARCVDAMVEAGGYSSSLALWTRILEEKPEQRETAEKIIARAKEMMTHQGRELIEQVALDEKAGRRQSALCSALAAQELFRRVKADTKDRASAQSLVKRLSNELKVVDQPPTPTPGSTKSSGV